MFTYNFFKRFFFRGTNPSLLMILIKGIHVQCKNSLTYVFNHFGFYSILFTYSLFNIKPTEYVVYKNAKRPYQKENKSAF